MMNLNRASAMKAELLQNILQNEEIMRLVMDTPNVKLPCKEARYTQVFPWKKAIGTQEEARTLICFEVSMSAPLNNATRMYTLTVWVMTHESLMPLDDAVGKRLNITDRGTRVDVLADKIDYLINGSTEFGFERLEIQGSAPFNAGNSFVGRSLHYSVPGWNRYGEKV